MSRPSFEGGSVFASREVVLERFSRWSSVVIAAATLGFLSCDRQDSRLQQHQEALESLGSTTLAIGEAWLAGSVSGTYTRTALEQTFRLVEQERAALASSPQSLLDPRGARLSQSAEHLSRLLALMIGDVRAADAASAGQRLSQIPIMAAAPKPSEGGIEQR
jgi:hypothetical protein